MENTLEPFTDCIVVQKSRFIPPALKRDETPNLTRPLCRSGFFFAALGLVSFPTEVGNRSR